METNNYINLQRAIIQLEGPDTAHYLQNMISNDLDGAETKNQAIYTFLLTPQGKYLFDFFIVKKDETYFIEIAEQQKLDFMKKLKMYKLRSNVSIVDVSDKYLAIATANSDFEISYADLRSSAMPHRAIVTRDELRAKNLNEIDINEYHELRIENNIPEGIYDLEPDKSYPLQYRMKELQAVDFKKGCYVGQEVTARTHHRGVIRKTVYKITSTNNVESGQEVQLNEVSVGKVLSAKGASALALLEIEAVQNHAGDLEIMGQSIAVSQ